MKKEEILNQYIMLTERWTETKAEMEEYIQIWLEGKENHTAEEIKDLMYLKKQIMLDYQCKAKTCLESYEKCILKEALHRNESRTSGMHYEISLQDMINAKDNQHDLSAILKFPYNVNELTPTEFEDIKVELLKQVKERYFDGHLSIEEMDELKKEILKLCNPNEYKKEEVKEIQETVPPEKEKNNLEHRTPPTRKAPKIKNPKFDDDLVYPDYISESDNFMDHELDNINPNYILRIDTQEGNWHYASYIKKAKKSTEDEEIQQTKSKVSQDYNNDDNMPDIVYVFYDSYEGGIMFYDTTGYTSVDQDIFTTDRNSVNFVMWDDEVNKENGSVLLRCGNSLVKGLTIMVSKDKFFEVCDQIQQSNPMDDEITIDLSGRYSAR